MRKNIALVRALNCEGCADTFRGNLQKARTKHLGDMGNTVTTTELTNQIDAIVARKDTLILGLNPEQKSWRTHAGSWSVIECLEHLNRTNAMYLRAMRVAFERDRHNTSLPPKAFRLGFLGRQFVRYLEPPVHLKTPAPRSVIPPEGLNDVEVETEFNRQHLELRGFILEAGRLDMGAIRFPSPMSALLKLNLAEGCSIITAHDRRHLWQAERVRNHPEFPIAQTVAIPEE